MREIKFRGWRNGFGMEYYSDLVQIPTNYHNTVELMQYTGLKDKNGKEIYEGDIRKGEYHSNNEKFTVTNVMEWDNGYYWTGGYFPDFIDTEIIGNIYENPELVDD